MLLEANEICAFSQSLVAAVSGLIGVFVGGWITAWNQRNERRNTYLRDQLREFYAPLLGMCTALLAKAGAWSEITQSSTKRQLDSLHQASSEDAVYRISENIQERNKELAQYCQDRFDNELFPIYQNMLDRFTSHMWLSEPSTLKFYAELVKLVELLERHKHDVVDLVAFAESVTRVDPLERLKRDLEDHSEVLKRKLKG